MFRIERGGEGAFEVLTLKDSTAGSTALIAPNYGFNCFSFRCRVDGAERDLIYAEPGFPSSTLKATRNGVPLLAPFPNRIRGGKFSYGGRDFTLPCNDQGMNAIHGFAVDQAWRVTAETTEGAAEVLGEFQLHRDRPDYSNYWPTDFILTVAYRLRGNRLTTTAEVTNPSSSVLPFGFGAHPYFRVGLEAAEEANRCRIRSPATLQVELVDTLPTGRTSPVAGRTDLRSMTPIGGLLFDDVFTGLQADADGRIRHYLVDEQARTCVELEHGPELPYSVIFTPQHRRALCIEPYTCVTDAIHFGARLGDDGPPSGLWELQPGEKRGFTYHITATAGPPQAAER